ncbi:hypothetical protein VNO77_34462 [Canavalia gladiata]|uniref:Uncharacterized protein n=1 Tax=Canavalia gladiata TaxID=3824 RepID=A0AAN9KDM4_CANGL
MFLNLSFLPHVFKVISVSHAKIPPTMQPCFYFLVSPLKCPTILRLGQLWFVEALGMYDCKRGGVTSHINLIAAFALGRKYSKLYLLIMDRRSVHMSLDTQIHMNICITPKQSRLQQEQTPKRVQEQEWPSEVSSSPEDMPMGRKTPLRAAFLRAYFG